MNDHRSQLRLKKPEKKNSEILNEPLTQDPAIPVQFSYHYWANQTKWMVIICEFVYTRGAKPSGHASYNQILRHVISSVESRKKFRVYLRIVLEI